MESKDNLAVQLERLLQNTSAERLQEEFQKLQRLMSCYRCAILEVETKFRVLNEQFSLQHERNPIESIKSRLKSMESIQEKLQRKGYPMNAESIQKN